MAKKIFNKFFIGFLNGIVIILPLTITVLIIMFVVGKINAVVLNPLLGLFPRSERSLLHIYSAKFLILICVLVLIYLIGWAAKILFVRRVFSWGERLFVRIPIMGKIYNASKQIATAFLGHGKTIFKQVVVVEYPRKGVFAVGFTTGMAKGEIKDAINCSGINVFIPTTPNPTSGLFIIFPKEQVKFLKMSVEDGMKLVISGGSVMPSEMEV